MTTDLDRLNAAILDDPTDDLLRMIFADACDEAGDLDRAEFVRASLAYHAVGLHACPTPVYEMVGGKLRSSKLIACGRCHWCRAAQRVEAAHDACGKSLFGDLSHRFSFAHAWKAPHLFDDYPRERFPSLYLERGFVAEVAMPLELFAAHAATMFAAHPVERVRLTDRVPRVVFQERYHGWARQYPHPAYQLRPPSQAETLPPEMWDALGSPLPDGADGWRCYPTAEEAQAALSEACVRHGRRLAGLGPLTAGGLSNQRV